MHMHIKFELGKQEIPSKVFPQNTSSQTAIILKNIGVTIINLIKIWWLSVL